MKSLILLLDKTLQDCSVLCGTTTTRDFKTISRRVEHEGLSFLTITLGNFATDFERSLEQGFIDSNAFASFAKTRSIPKLLSGMTSLVFDFDGRLLNQPSIQAISSIRQVCRMWKKILVPCTKERNDAAIDGYIKLEKSLSMLRVGPDFDDISHFCSVSDILWSSVLGPLSSTIENLEHIPKHGSGNVASKVLPNQKYNWTQWHQRLEQFFPSDYFAYNSAESFMEESSKIEYLDPAQEQPVRVVFVPKTLKTPRVIGIEPACMQYTQQSLLSLIVDRIESHSMTSRHINFRDQSINAKLALSSSSSRNLATLDLSEASDRVHKDVVYYMLRSIPILRDAIFACRSTTASLPGGLNLPLQKFASMGSALCFPIESMVFFTILISREIRRLNLPLTSQSIRFVGRNVYIYGDDIIIPVDMVPTATLALESFGLKVNSDKSFSKGNFRESCGMDAYDGVDVSTVYVRRLLPSSGRDVSGVLSLVALGNQLYSRAYFSAATFIEEYLRSLNLKLPYVTDRSSCVGHIRGVTPTTHRWNDKLHRPEVYGYVVVPRVQSDIIDGRQALMKWFLKGLNPDKDHFLHSVGSGRLTVKRRWSAVFY